METQHGKINLWVWDNDNILRSGVEQADKLRDAITLALVEEGFDD